MARRIVTFNAKNAKSGWDPSASSTRTPSSSRLNPSSTEMRRCGRFCRSVIPPSVPTRWPRARSVTGAAPYGGFVAYQLSTHQRTQASPTRPSSSHVHRRVGLGLDRPGALGAPLPRAAWRAGGLSRANPADQFVGRSVRSPAPSIDGLGAPRFDGCQAVGRSSRV